MIARRRLIDLLTVAAMSAAVRPALAGEPATVLRVGTQKGAGILMAERQQRGLESLLGPSLLGPSLLGPAGNRPIGDRPSGINGAGIDVQWVDFQFGPPILEAMRAGSIDIGLVGDTPPIFAQAAGSDLLYVGVVPSGASAILVPPGSPLQTLQDLKGRRLAYARGSSAHNLMIAALEKAGLRLQDVQATPLAPADAAAAFERGSIDAWTIWDPFYALAQARPGVRVLAESTAIAPQNSFLIARREFVQANPTLTDKVISDLARISRWATTHRDEVAKLITDSTGMSLAATTTAAQRSPFQVLPVTDDTIQAQQQVADRFYRLGIIPTAITVKDQVWQWRPSS